MDMTQSNVDLIIYHLPRYGWLGTPMADGSCVRWADVEALLGKER